MPTPENDPGDPRTRREIVGARRSLLLIFGVGAVAIAVVIAWVVRSLPGGVVPTGYLPDPAPNPSQRACVRAGIRCEHSPGKLGICAERPDCVGSACLFCQSQH